jgi:hypothetical protein
MQERVDIGVIPDDCAGTSVCGCDFSSIGNNSRDPAHVGTVLPDGRRGLLMVVMVE